MLEITKIKPSVGYLLIKQEKLETSEGLLTIPGSSENLKVGKVIAINSKIATNEHGISIDVPCSENDLILYKPWGGNEVKIGAKTYLVLRFEDVIATIQE